MRRATGNITLALLGVVLLGGCDRTVQTRDGYLSLNDCVHDWGDAAKCERGQMSSTGSHFYYGPGYSGTRIASGASSQSRAISSHSTVRGGFGASASAHAGSSG